MIASFVSNCVATTMGQTLVGNAGAHTDRTHLPAATHGDRDALIGQSSAVPRAFKTKGQTLAGCKRCSCEASTLP